ncbi:hypothetical protein DES48_1302 [Paraliobacillus ryukyuensis]|uniref:Uncharacterized protein n=1 Tax=Paraliobacillus ryukyuensis TaxID=200904 RepID=A0A366DMZ4_9BACI|nr:hypothetical protein [Paraliobacillus ryukyuensis]RBO90598.1 hypothetical protein DES48_1302 [Paraliobacillus ryukyuensis]
MGTWFKVDRDIFDSDIWNDVTTFRLFIYLIGKATHQDGTKIAGIELERGQYLRSYRMIAKDLAYKEGRGRKEYSLRTIKKAIDKLISAERVNVRETEQGTLFTILNYAKYQRSNDDEKESVNTLNEEVNTNGKRSVNNNNNANKARKNKNNKKRHKYEICDMSLAELLYSKILENNPEHKKPNLEKWADDFRKMRNLDDRTEEQIKYLIDWTQSDDFWHRNILSAEKLREKYDQLVIQVKAERKNKHNNVVPIRADQQEDTRDYGF